MAQDSDSRFFVKVRNFEGFVTFWELVATLEEE